MPNKPVKETKRQNRLAKAALKKQQHFNHVGFLLAAAELNGLPPGLKQHYHFIAKKVADKTQVRLNRSTKAQFCQKCCAPFPENLTVKKKKFDYFVYNCSVCHFGKRIRTTINKPKK